MTRILAPVLCGLVLFVRPVHATTHVYPGPGTPLQDAIDAAVDGAILVVHHGGYEEAVTVTKRLRLVHPKNEDLFFQPTLIITCAAPAALTIAADGVRVYGIQVRGGTVSSVDIQNRDDVKLDRVSTTNYCGTAQHALNVYASTRVKVFRSGSDNAYADAGTYIHGIPAGGKVRLKQSFVTHSARGVAIEDSGPGSVTVQGSNFVALDMGGILLRNSDGILLKANKVQTASGIGIELDATSDGNRIDRNEILSGGVDVVDSGTGNCWLRNTYSTGTVPPCP